MLLQQAIVETVIFVLVLLTFKSMYVNKYGLADTNKDDLSDLGDKTVNNTTMSNQELVYGMR